MNTTATGKKLINSVERCVDDNLDGFVALNPGIRLLKGHRVLIRADIEDLQKAGKVAVVCGGGSGHEPAQSGYVGKGMLAAAAMGSVFAAPPPSEMLAAIRAAAKNNPAGCLLLIPNYTGDRLNFGLAAERAQGEGIKIATCVVGEDCALTTTDRSAGRRGLTGIPVSIKIAGALAEEGRSLEDIVSIVDMTVKNMATIGVALSPCFVPGSGPTFTLPPDEMELGLGVHGEAGVRRLKMMSAKETVSVMLDHMTNPENPNHLPLSTGDRVAVFINDLGGISHMELNIIAKESIAYLETRGILVIRALCSSFVTSLDMSGTHVTVLRLSHHEVLRSLDAPTLAPNWPRCLLPPGVSERFTPTTMDVDPVQTEETEDIQTGISFSTEEGNCLVAMVIEACNALIKAEANLNFLDSGAGDGDCGSTLARGAKGVLKELTSATQSQDLLGRHPGILAHRLAGVAESQMGGASGALYGLFFTGVAAALKQTEHKDVWTEALALGLTMIKRYGGAEPGDRTMLDALQPVLDSLRASQSIHVQAVAGQALTRFHQAVLAAERGAEATRDMKAHAGRASYVSSSLLLHPDPGAVGVATWMRAAYNSVVASASAFA